MKKIKFAILALSLVIFFIGCDKDDNPKPPDNPNPTAEGLGFIEASSAELQGSEIVPELMMGTLPTSYFLNMPAPANQGAQGSCVSWAVAYATQSYNMNKANGTNYGTPQNLCSPKYVYNQSKYYPNDCNGGSTYPAAFEVLKTKGVCTWSDMPYNDTECSLLPNSLQNTAAAKNKIIKWERVNKNDITNIKTILYSGFPVMIAVIVDQSFYNLQSPYIWSSKYGNTSGGHAITVVGYDDNKSAFKVQNSWGANWKDNGHLWISYSFFSQAVRNEECYVVYPAITSPSDNLNQGLVLNLPFSGNANDVSGNNNNGIVNNALIVSDRKGNPNSAYLFKGYTSPSYIKVQNSTSFNFPANNFSISFWVKFNNPTGQNSNGVITDGINNQTSQTLFSKWSGGIGMLFEASFYQGNIGLHLNNGGGDVDNRLNTWMHFTYVYTNGTRKFYKNGSLIWSTPIALGGFFDNNSDFYIGQLFNTSSQYKTPFDGTLDEIRVYNRALNESEVQKIYQY
jgi:Concanavalin A-like lectin/glucanases superfamily/Papain family cysteine protease